MRIASASELNAITRALQRAKLRIECRRLSKYLPAMWQVIEPATPFIPGWHLDVISEHLEAVSAGHIRVLIINMPPRHAKSISTSVAWPTWEWGPAERPTTQWLYSSYSGALSIRDSLKCRRLIQSKWYQDLWGDVFQLTGDQNAKQRFENDKFGYRLATSVGGVGTGEGGKFVVSDDPNSTNESESDAIRESTNDWWAGTMATRLNDPKTGAFVINQQRTHERDVSGFELAQQLEDYAEGEIIHLRLPAQFEAKHKCSTIVNGHRWEDPRTKEGELLWPTRFDDKSIQRIAKKLGTYRAAGQLQQRPAPSGGGIFKSTHLRLWPAGKALPKFLRVIQSYDTAYTAETFNDPTALTAWGLFEYKGRRRVMLLDAWEERLEYDDLRRRAKEEYKATYGDDDVLTRPDTVLIEAKGSGISLRQDLVRSGVPAVAYNPQRDDKVARAYAAQPFWEDGLVWVPESVQEAGKPVTWAAKWLRDLELFPNGEDDHYVDTTTQVLALLRDQFELEISYDAPEEDPEVDYHKAKPKPNPYAS